MILRQLMTGASGCFCRYNRTIAPASAAVVSSLVWWCVRVSSVYFTGGCVANHPKSALHSHAYTYTHTYP